MLARGLEYLFCLDSDVVTPPDTILRLQSHRQPIISGVYFRRSQPFVANLANGQPVGIPVMQKNGGWCIDYPPNSVIEVDVVGAGCLLIHRSVFENMPHQRPGKPWFDWRVDMQEHLPREKCLSEDFTFCFPKNLHGLPLLKVLN